MSNILTWKFWSTPNPPAMLPSTEHLFIALLVILILVGVIFSVLKNKAKAFKKLFTEIYYFSFTNAFLGLLILFFTTERIRFFSARFWFILWGIVMLIWGIYICRKGIKMPREKRLREEAKKFNKYIP